jgi:hypothetical protein
MRNFSHKKLSFRMICAAFCLFAQFKCIIIYLLSHLLPTNRFDNRKTIRPFRGKRLSLSLLPHKRVRVTRSPTIFQSQIILSVGCGCSRIQADDRPHCLRSCAVASPPLQPAHYRTCVIRLMACYVTRSNGYKRKEPLGIRPPNGS